MSTPTMFYQKNGLIIIKLSRDLLTMAVGDRMTPMWQYVEKFSVSRGTVHGAIKFLLDNRCLAIEKMGPKGSYITSLNYGKLWEYVDWGILTGAMAFPEFMLQKGLGTAIAQAMQKKHIPFNFAFVMASESRLKALISNRYHFVITAKLAMNI